MKKLNFFNIDGILANVVVEDGFTTRFWGTNSVAAEVAVTEALDEIITANGGKIEGLNAYAVYNEVVDALYSSFPEVNDSFVRDNCIGDFLMSRGATWSV